MAQRTAAFEGFGTQMHKRCRQPHSGKEAAIGEGGLPDVCHGVRDGELSQAVAVPKGLAAYASASKAHSKVYGPWCLVNNLALKGMLIECLLNHIES